MPQATTTDISSFTPAQQAAFKASEALSGGVAKDTTNPTQAVNATPPKIGTSTPLPNVPANPTTPVVPAATPKPITTISSDQGAQNAADNATKLATLKNTGLTLGPDGLARYSDSSFATAPSDAVQNPETGTWQSGGVQYAIGPATSTDPELQAMNDQITQMKTQFDSTSRAAIDNIQQQFQTLIKQQTDINTRSQASLDQSLLMGGSSRYAQDSSSGQSTAMMSYGLSQIADLNTKEQAAVIAAQQAQDSGDMKLMDQQLTLAQKARDDKQAAATALSAKLVKANDDLKAKAAQASQEQAVAGIIAQGITDPSQIQDMMNNYDDGSSTGTNLSLKDINDMISNMNPDAQDVHQIMLDAAKQGASPDVLKAIGQAKDVAGAINAAGSSLVDPSSSYGQYLAYQTKAQSLGQSPVSYQDWSDATKAKADQMDVNKSLAIAGGTKAIDSKYAYNDAYNAAAGKNAADQAFSESDTNQQKLEQQYRTVLEKEVSNKTGVIGTQSAKIDQANHLKALVDKYKDANGNYNIPTSQYSELAIGLATLVSPSNTTSDADRAEIKAKTAAGDIKGAIQYITGTPQNGNTQDMIKNLVDSIDRQGQVAQQLRDQDVGFLQGLKPTDLDPDRAAALEKNLLPSYGSTSTEDPIIEAETEATNTLKDYVTANPSKSDEIKQRIQTMESQTGKPVTAADFLQAFPEYGQTATPAQNTGPFGLNIGTGGANIFK